MRSILLSIFALAFLAIAQSTTVTTTVVSGLTTSSSTTRSSSSRSSTSHLYSCEVKTSTYSGTSSSSLGSSSSTISASAAAISVPSASTTWLTENIFCTCGPVSAILSKTTEADGTIHTLCSAADYPVVTAGTSHVNMSNFGQLISVVESVAESIFQAAESSTERSTQAITQSLPQQSIIGVNSTMNGSTTAITATTSDGSSITTATGLPTMPSATFASSSTSRSSGHQAATFENPTEAVWHIVGLGAAFAML